MATDITIEGSDIEYSDFSIEVGTSDLLVAPKANVVTNADQVAGVTAGDAATITIDGTDRFVGECRNGGTINGNGSVELKLRHPATALLKESVDISLTAPVSFADPLTEALNQATRGGNFSIDFPGTPADFDQDYQVSNRSVKQVFRDVRDRTNRQWWIDPAGTVIHFHQDGFRGTWKSLDTQQDPGVAVQSFDPGDVETVRNDVTVTATGGEAVSDNSQDATSISTYGRQSEDVNIAYAATQQEAKEMADQLLVPDPQAEAKILVGQNVGDITQPLASYEVDITDPTTNVNATGLKIEKQTIKQGRVTLEVGEGKGTSLAAANRAARSSNDETEPGSVYGNDRLAPDSVDTEQVRDFAIEEFKLQDGAVKSIKLGDGSVLTTKLDNLAVTETKIDDDSISTPKLQAGAVEADRIDTGTITGAEFTRIADGEVVGSSEIINLLADKVIFASTGDTADGLTTAESGTTVIQGGKIETNSINAGQIDTLDLDTDELTIGNDTNARIEFFTDLDGNTSIEPDADGSASIGFTNDFDFISAEQLNATVQLSIQGGSNHFFEVDGATPRLVIDEEGGTTYFSPQSDNDGQLGTTTEAWSDVYAHNYVTASPDAIDGVDTADIAGTDWYDSPPEAVRERARAIGDTDEEIPEGMDHTPVELGTMANWLLETCKSQQEHIEDQSARIDDLEARLEELERQENT